MNNRTLFLFQTTRDAIKAERILVARHKKIKVIPIPRSISSQCGMALELIGEPLQELRDILSDQNITVNIWRD